VPGVAPAAEVPPIVVVVVDAAVQLRAQVDNRPRAAQHNRLFRQKRERRLNQIAGGERDGALREAPTRVRGGFGENLRVHDLHLDGVKTPIKVTLNWNPAYSYATLPKDTDPKTVPPYWIPLTTPVPPEKGLPHFHDVHIWNIDAKNAATAIDMSAYPNATLDNFMIDHVTIAAKSAGSIVNTRNLKLNDIQLKIEDGSVLKFTDNAELQGQHKVQYGVSLKQ